MIQLSRTYRGLSMMIAEDRLAVLSLTIPELPFSTTRRAHSIILERRNVLNFIRKIFLLMV